MRPILRGLRDVLDTLRRPRGQLGRLGAFLQHLGPLCDASESVYLCVGPVTLRGYRFDDALEAFYLGAQCHELLCHPRHGARIRLRTDPAGHHPAAVYRDGATRTKGGHQRYRELPAPAWQAIRRALIALGTPWETLAPEDPLFPISGRGFAGNLKRYAKRAGLEGVTPHVLRHSAAKIRRETGASIEDVGTFLGHRSLHTTSVYLRHLEGETDPGWHGVAAALGIEPEGCR